MCLEITAAGDHFEITVRAEKLLQEEHVDVDGSVIIFNNADIAPASYEVIGVAFQKSCLAGSEKSGDEVDFAHGILL